MVAKWVDGKMVLMKGEVLNLADRIDTLIKGSGVSGVQVVLEGAE